MSIPESGLKYRSLDAVLYIAASQIGIKEYPANSNRTKYGEEYGMNGQPWCVMFVWWVMREAGFLGFAQNKTASCTQLYNRYKSQAPEQVVYGNYKPGDLALMDFSGKRLVTQHIGIVEKVSTDGKTITLIEGNTSVNGSQDNGGAVLRKVRSSKEITAAIRIKYS